MSIDAALHFARKVRILWILWTVAHEMSDTMAMHGRIPICGSMGSHPLGFVWLNNLCAGVHLYLAERWDILVLQKITLGAVFYAMALRFARKANFYVRDAMSRVNSYAPLSQFSGYFWPFVEFRNGVDLWYPLVKDSKLPFF